MAGGLFKHLLYLIILLLYLHGVCGQECGPLDYDIPNLRRGSHFWFTREDCVISAPIEHDNSSFCLFLFSVCKPVDQLCSRDSGMCETFAKKNYSQITWPQDLGIVTGAKFTKQAVKTFTYEYSSSDKFKGCRNKKPLKTSITFQCHINNTAGKDWIDSDYEDIRKPPYGRPAAQPVSFTFVKDKCELNIVFNSSSSEICRFSPGSGGSSAAPSLSAGSILLILFFPAVLLYLITGVLINRSQGKSGKELIPNYSFWSQLPGLIGDGFAFTFAKLTCSNMTTTRDSYDRM